MPCRYDTNKSGELEKGQLIELLRRVSADVQVGFVCTYDALRMGSVRRSSVLTVSEADEALTRYSLFALCPHCR